MKKRILLTILIIVLFAATVAMQWDMSGYLKTFEENWGIEFPKQAGCKEAYAKDSGASFHGDGIRYHIFDVEKEERITAALVWQTEDRETIFCESLFTAANQWMDEIQVPQSKRPDYPDCVFWYSSQSDSSELILLWDEDEEELYIIESFL
ncbi:MAG: hypothetical protein IJO79_00090 [Firmicutes bacterium]|nr:hypothetical protein [Bacillota bacterium]